jgi:selenide,water dikinase
MGRGSKVTLRVDAKRVPLIPEALDFARAGLKTGADRTNREYVAGGYENRGVEAAIEVLLVDPQTSGGLLLAVDPSHADAMIAELRRAGALVAEVIGEVLPYDGKANIRIE